ncbi:hypothetical protein SLH46_03765 [Draconibacterium sp. IB214405]|uniref:Cbp1 family collagen-binding glycoprotein adhesin n=1 Tax=Draconibacterium sp. IB214405 TaxID=3097352 RepID=UPI002A107B01|nr:hypothetical protein [Draconibacterium sp. IB214405]MDX8338288.1 hypothetical protein [Draconibacterium sp. IB214405]
MQKTKEEEIIMKINRKIQGAVSIVLVVVLVIAALVGISTYTEKTNEINELHMQYAGINQDLQERDSMVNELVSAFDEIEQNLKFVKEKRQVLSVESKQEGNYDRKQAVIEDITLMNEMLEKSSEHIAQLERKLKNSGFEISSFKKKIAALNKSIDEQNTQIVALQQQIEERDIMLADMSQTIDTMQIVLQAKQDTLLQQQQLIDEKIYQLNKGFVAYGTFKELEEHNVLTKGGGFLGLGKQVKLKRNMDQDYFTELDIHDTKSIPLFSNTATIISEHPDSSYSFVEQDGVVAYLNIDNPDEFWKISKYAVIEIK